MSPINVKKAYEVAEQLDKQLTGYDLIYTAMIHHDDGSFHVVTNALVYKWEQYYLVFAEHARPDVYHEEDGSVFQLADMNIEEIKEPKLPFVRELIIDDLPAKNHAFARIPKEDAYFWIIEPELKYHGKTIKIISADDSTVKATENFTVQDLVPWMWTKTEKEAWDAKELAKKSDPDWIEYLRLAKKFEND